MTTIATTPAQNLVCNQEGKKLVAGPSGVVIEDAVTLISFTIGETTYQAEEGMTWSEWIESEYNTGWYYLEDNVGMTVIEISKNHYVCHDDGTGTEPSYDDPAV